MLQLLIHNYVLHTHTHTHTHIDTHIRAYVHGYTTAPCTRSTKADQLTVDLARRAHQSPGRLVNEDGLRVLLLAQRTGQGQSGVVDFLVWELVRLQEPLHCRRREDGLNSTHIFPVKSATACTEVTVTGKMWIGPPKDRCGRILETLPFARERPPFCLRKRQHSRDTTYIIHYLRTSTLHVYGQKTYTTHTEGNICRPVQLTPVDLQRGKVKTLLGQVSLSVQ